MEKLTQKTQENNFKILKINFSPFEKDFFEIFVYVQMTQDMTMLYLNNAQQVYNTQLGSNNPQGPEFNIGHSSFGGMGENLVNYTRLKAKHNCQGQKTPWNTLFEILRLRRPNHLKIPYQHILLQTPRGHGQNDSTQKLVSQYWLDMKMDQLIHWNQTLDMFVNQRLLR